MKPTCAIALLAVTARLACGGTFIGPTTSTNRLLIPTNSAIIITAIFGDFTNSTQIQFDGGFSFTQPDFAPLESGTTYALAGPAELICSNTVLLTFYPLTNSAIRTQVILNDPIGIPIASNKTMHLFGVPASVSASFSRLDSTGGGALSFTLEPNSAAEFTGPGTLYLNSGVFFPYAKFISYFIAEDGIVLPGQRAMAGPSGSFAISVEKSLDLMNWSPVLMGNSSDPTKAFYRLQIQR
jgi:hypothetical protein